jgi:excisionase family DNA binding protein
MRARTVTEQPPLRLCVTVAEAAEALGVGTRTVQKRIYAGQLPVVREGRAIRIRVVDLER